MESYYQGNKKKVRFVGAELYEFHPIEVPKEFYDSTGGPFKYTETESWLVLYNDNGTKGQCPCSHKMKDILEVILNGETKSYDEWRNILYWRFRNNGFSSEMTVQLGRLDLAFQDMLAKEANMPLHKYLGATRDWVNVYASGCGTNLTMNEMEAEVAASIEGGYTTFKMKIGTNFGTEIERDVERVKTVRSMIGKDARLAIDANQLWNAEQALEFADKVEKYDLAWYEEPVHSHNFLELKKLTEKCPIPVSMGESIRCYYPMEVYVWAGIKHLQCNQNNYGYIGDWKKAQELAISNNLDFSSGGMSHISAALIATGREEDIVEYLIPIVKPFYNIMDVKPIEKEGKFYLPSTPGLGLIPDFKLFERKNYIRIKEYY